jgi:tRNA (cmo5U34)-methyltransferase
MATPMQQKSSLTEIRDRFDNEVERFSNLITGQQATMDAPLVMDLITQAAKNATPNARRVLDIGCGAGNNTLKLIQMMDHPMDCDMVDLSRPMLERARQRISAVNRGEVRLFQEDIRTVDLPKGHYDIILAAMVLHHLRDDRDWEDTFRKLYDLTAPGGSIWIADFVAHENPVIQNIMWDRYGKYLETMGGSAYREKVFAYIDKEDTPRPVTYQMDLLRKAGFTVVEILHKNSCFVAFGAIKQRS